MICVKLELERQVDGFRTPLLCPELSQLWWALSARSIVEAVDRILLGGDCLRFEDERKRNMDAGDLHHEVGRRVRLYEQAEGTVQQGEGPPSKSLKRIHL